MRGNVTKSSLKWLPEVFFFFTLAILSPFSCCPSAEMRHKIMSLPRLFSILTLSTQATATVHRPVHPAALFSQKTFAHLHDCEAVVLLTTLSRHRGNQNDWIQWAVQQVSCTFQQLHPKCYLFDHLMIYLYSLYCILQKINELRDDRSAFKPRQASWRSSK